MADVRLRPLRSDDVAVIAANEGPDKDPWNWFGHLRQGGLEARIKRDGATGADQGNMAVETVDGVLVGSVSWHAVHHGPPPDSRCINIGISLFPEHRGHGYGVAAQKELAAMLFATQTIERVEASTDVDNRAEQKALERAGFRREGIMRSAQHRGGEWRDMVLYSRLRQDEP